MFSKIVAAGVDFKSVSTQAKLPPEYRTVYDFFSQADVPVHLTSAVASIQENLLCGHYQNVAKIITLNPKICTEVFDKAPQKDMSGDARTPFYIRLMGVCTWVPEIAKSVLSVLSQEEMCLAFDKLVLEEAVGGKPEAMILLLATMLPATKGKPYSDKVTQTLLRSRSLEHLFHLVLSACVHIQDTDLFNIFITMLPSDKREPVLKKVIVALDPSLENQKTFLKMLIARTGSEDAFKAIVRKLHPLIVVHMNLDSLVDATADPHFLNFAIQLGLDISKVFSRALDLEPMDKLCTKEGSCAGKVFILNDTKVKIVSDSGFGFPRSWMLENGENVVVLNEQVAIQLNAEGTVIGGISLNPVAQQCRYPTTVEVNGQKLRLKNSGLIEFLSADDKIVSVVFFHPSLEKAMSPEGVRTKCGIKHNVPVRMFVLSTGACLQTPEAVCLQRVLNSPDKNGNCVIHTVARLGDDGFLIMMFRYGGYHHWDAWQNKNGETPLHLAQANKKLVTLQLLVAHYAQISRVYPRCTLAVLSLRNTSGESFLSIAVREKSYVMVRSIWDFLYIHLGTEEAQTVLGELCNPPLEVVSYPLMMALYLNLPMIARLLLTITERRDNLDAAAIKGETWPLLSGLGLTLPSATTVSPDLLAYFNSLRSVPGAAESEAVSGDSQTLFFLACSLMQFHTAQEPPVMASIEPDILQKIVCQKNYEMLCHTLDLLHKLGKDRLIQFIKQANSEGNTAIHWCAENGFLLGYRLLVFLCKSLEIDLPQNNKMMTPVDILKSKGFDQEVSVHAKRISVFLDPFSDVSTVNMQLWLGRDYSWCDDARNKALMGQLSTCYKEHVVSHHVGLDPRSVAKFFDSAHPVATRIAAVTSAGGGCTKV